MYEDSLNIREDSEYHVVNIMISSISRVSSVILEADMIIAAINTNRLGAGAISSMTCFLDLDWCVQPIPNVPGALRRPRKDPGLGA